MKLLEDMILEKGKVINEDVLKVNSFINHQIDSKLMFRSPCYKWRVGIIFFIIFQGHAVADF